MLCVRWVFHSEVKPKNIGLGLYYGPLQSTLQYVLWVGERRYDRSTILVGTNDVQYILICQEYFQSRAQKECAHAMNIMVGQLSIIFLPCNSCKNPTVIVVNELGALIGVHAF